MAIFRRSMLLGLLAGASLCPAAHAAEWPERPITLIVPAAPGGTTDIVSRILAEKLRAELGQTVVVENRAGAAGIIGTQQLARATPDGYTLIMGNIGPNAINYSLYKKLPYKAEDFQPVTLVISVPNILVVGPGSPAKTVAELVALVRANPGKHSFGSSGTGQSPHLSGEMFKQRAGLDATHIPFKGAGPAVAALMADQFSFMIDNLPSSMQQIKGGKLRALAITSDTRSPELPNVPTMAEAGIKDMDVTAWFGLIAPAGTPMPIVDKVQQATRKILATPDMQARFRDMGGKPGGNTPSEFAAFIDAERTRWKQTVETAGLSMEQ